MNVSRSASEPILCAHLIRQIDVKLLELLESLKPSEWDLQTVAPRWRVRDVAAHLLDTMLRKLTMARDRHFADSVQINSREDLVALVNRLNDEGVRVYRRLSPAVLIDLMRLACEQSAQFHESLDPFAPAAFPVSWAGEDSSLNWFDTARELTERWHHQQQIRLATNRPGIMTRELYHPVLDCFARGLPHLYRDNTAPVGSIVCVNISGNCGGEWFVSKHSTGWKLVSTAAGTLDARVTIPQEIAWRIFTKGIAHDSATAEITFEGDESLGKTVLFLTAIVG